MASKEYFGKTDLLFLCQLLYTEVNKYVKKVEGKDLSSNDFTNELKAKLVGIDLTKYATLESPVLTGTPKAPTATAGDSSTQIATTSYVVTAVTNAVKDITGIQFVKVDSYEDLPAIGAKGTIYLVPKATAGTDDVYDEYFWDGDATSGKYEHLGSTSIDLSDYLKKTDVVELSTDEVKAVWDSVFTNTTTPSEGGTNG